MVNPLILKPAPDTPAAVMFRLVWPVFVNVLVSVWLVPKPTLPKPTLTGEELNSPCVGGVTTLDLALIPWQPANITADTRASKSSGMSRWGKGLIIGRNRLIVRLTRCNERDELVCWF
jgi:hypothetical protein